MAKTRKKVMSAKQARSRIANESPQRLSLGGRGVNEGYYACYCYAGTATKTCASCGGSIMRGRGSVVKKHDANVFRRGKKITK